MEFSVVIPSRRRVFFRYVAYRIACWWKAKLYPTAVSCFLARCFFFCRLGVQPPTSATVVTLKQRLDS